MKAQIWMFFLLITSVHTIYAQIDERFDQNMGFISNDWFGDTQLFVFVDGRLRLNDTEAGTATLQHPIVISDQWEYELDIELDFSPSSQNQLKWILWSNDNVGELFVLIGETGSDDAIQIWQNRGGQLELLGRGMDGMVSDDPVCLNLKATKMGPTLIIDAVYCDGMNEQLSIEWHEEFVDEGIFRLECVYTSSRADLFWFDNIYAGPIRVDERPPRLIDFQTDRNNTVLTFDEGVVAPIASNFILSNTTIPVNLNHDGGSVTLTWNPPLEAGIEYQLDIIGIGDVRDNFLDTTVRFSIFPVIEPEALLINEILFDPVSTGVDFLELVNVSQQALNLSGLHILNEDNGGIAVILQELILPPNEVVALTENPEDILDRYPTHRAERVIRTALPDMSNAFGDIILEYEQQQIDRLIYDDDLHHFLYDDVEGVSLERISTSVDITVEDNWTSASELVGFATPGVANSVRKIESANIIELSTKVISPNGDSMDDDLLINYEFEQPDYIATISIYNDRGQHIVDLVNNKTLGTSGQIRWDARYDSGEIADQGIYVVIVELFNQTSSDGFKKSFAISKLNN